MLLDLLGNLQKILENCKIKLDDLQLKALAETLEYHKGGILPANVLKRELNISYADVHSLMTYLSTQGILKVKYKVYCENDAVTGASRVYDDIADIPVSICDRCQKECVLLKNIYIEFEVCI